MMVPMVYAAMFRRRGATPENDPQVFSEKRPAQRAPLGHPSPADLITDKQGRSLLVEQILLHNYDGIRVIYCFFFH